MLIPVQTMLQGRYQIIRMIAQGGIGAVYEAFDTRLQGRVAIKQLMYSGAAGLQTFEREARMMNSLRHPGLARVSDYFSEATNQFLVMDYIEGNDLAEMLAQRGTAFDVPVVLDWMHQLLTIITYLHNHKPEVLHRDIKPNNIKIAANNHLMLLDFGLSKGHSATQNFSIMGYTPHYAPLEQIQGTGTDARSDIYAIGATIYHLLTNHPPSDSLTRASSIIRSQPDPLIPPIQLNAGIPSDLNMMILQMLAQDPMQRPDSAATINHSIQTIRRLLVAMAPTVINPPPSIQSSTQPTIPKLVNQQPTTIPLSQTIGSSSSLPPISAKKSLSKKFKRIVVALLLISVFFGGILIKTTYFDSYGSFWENLQGHTDRITFMAWNPSGTILASASADKTIKLWNTFGVLLKSLEGHTDIVESLAWSPDGTILVSASADGIVRLWDSDGTIIKDLINSPNEYFSAVAWHPQDEMIAVGLSNGIIQLWELNGTFIKNLQGHTGIVRSLAWSINGQLLASGSGDATVRLWDDNGKSIQTLNGHEYDISSVIWHPDGSEVLASGSNDGTIRIWNIDRSLLQMQVQEHKQVTSIAWSPNGAIIVAGSTSTDTAIHLWNTDGSFIENLKRKSNDYFVDSVAWNPKRKLLAAAFRNNTIELWQMDENTSH